MITESEYASQGTCKHSEVRVHVISYAQEWWSYCAQGSCKHSEVPVHVTAVAPLFVIEYGSTLYIGIHNFFSVAHL